MWVHAEFPPTHVSASPRCAKGPRRRDAAGAGRGLRAATCKRQTEALAGPGRAGPHVSSPGWGCAGGCQRCSTGGRPAGRYRAPMRSAFSSPRPAPNKPTAPSAHRKHSCASPKSAGIAYRGVALRGMPERTHEITERSRSSARGHLTFRTTARCPPRSGPHTGRCPHRSALAALPVMFCPLRPAPPRRAPSCPRSAAACCRCCRAPRGTRSGTCS